MLPRSLFPRAQTPIPYAASGHPFAWLGDYTEAGIVGVRLLPAGGQLFITWDADRSVPDDVYYQIYINKKLKWVGAVRRATLPAPAGAGTTGTLHVGRVGAGNRGTNYAARLADPPGTGNRARLRWEGGRWSDPDISHYSVYSSLGPGEPVSLLAPVARVPAAPGGVWGDGHGRGPHGRGPHGRGVVAYEWVSPPLARGTWSFAVRAADTRGNLSAADAVVTLEVGGAPPAPRSVDGRALWIDSYDPATRSAVLAWYPSE